MPERKLWSQEQDKILRLLREERAERKWASIARIMQAQFGICGRSGKQCRQRYHNNLDSSIVISQWTPEQEQILYQNHEQIGNKWSLISQKLPGRSDNCVKNHFYSKLRKAVRRLNKLITDYFSIQHKYIKENVLSKIVKTTESKFKNNSKIDEELADLCNDIKNRLYHFQLRSGQKIEDIQLGKKLIIDIENFDRDYKKGCREIINQFEYQYKTYLKPPPQTLKKNSSTQSCSSMKSDDSSSYPSSSSYFSSNDLSQFQPQVIQKKNKKLIGSKSLGTTSGRNSQEIQKSQKIEEKLNKQDFYQKEQFYNKHILKPQTFIIQHEDLIIQDSEYYDRNNNSRDIDYINMHSIYDESPHIGCILAPRQIFGSFDLFSKQQDIDEIQFKAETDQMDIQ